MTSILQITLLFFYDLDCCRNIAAEITSSMNISRVLLISVMTKGQRVEFSELFGVNVSTETSIRSSAACTSSAGTIRHQVLWTILSWVPRRLKYADAALQGVYV